MSATQGAPAPIPPVFLLPASFDSFPLESGRPYVYILATTDRQRIKIGRSLDPLDRITGLINLYPGIDLARSAIIAVDTLRIELILHIVFSERRQKLAEPCDGYTEWFEGDFGEDVIAFCHRIAHHRGVDFAVVRNIDSVIQRYRQHNPMAGLRSPRLTHAQRQAAFPRVLESLTKSVTEQTERFLEILSESKFDAILCNEDRYFLVRTVHRNATLEDGASDPTIQPAAWRSRLLDAAQFSVRVEGASCCFHLLKPPTVEPLDEHRAREYYRIAQGPEDEPQTRDALSSVVNSGFQLLWQALAPLDRWERADQSANLAGPAAPDSLNHRVE